MEYGEVLDIKDYGDYKEVVTAKQTYQTKYVLIATGTKERQMNLEKENTQEHETIDKTDAILLDTQKFEKALSKALEIDEVDR